MVASVTSLGATLARCRRPLVAVALLTVCAAGQSGIAQAAPVFDVEAFSTCTATRVPGPDEDFDGMVTSCCVDNAGVPAATRYGLGCVAQVDNPPEDYRPTIVMPSRPSPLPEGDDPALDEMLKQPPPQA